MPLRTIIVGAILAAAALAAAAGGVAATSRSTSTDNDAPAVQLTAGPYTATVRHVVTSDGAQALVDLTDANGAPVTGKPLSAILAYQGTAVGHEHHDIFIGQERSAGRYSLALSEPAPGPWLLTIVIGDEGRATYLFAVP
ncbi:MAG: FixH family protein [Chloroflexota bacterium]|nr:FixH family protein [Chloroflexota bacterium]